MALRLLLLFIPLLTFAVPQRWFSFYATLLTVIGLVQVAMIFLLREQYTQALSSFGVEVVLGYIAVNLLLLGIRYRLIRRARARITKLPAPEARD